MFDLKKCRRNAYGHYIARTRSACDVRILATDVQQGPMPVILGLIKIGSHESVCKWAQDGTHLSSEQGVSVGCNDLINSPIKRHQDIVLYQLESQYLVRLASELAPPTWKRIVTSRLEWEE